MNNSQKCFLCQLQYKLTCLFGTVYLYTVLSHNTKIQHTIPSVYLFISGYFQWNSKKFGIGFSPLMGKFNHLKPTGYYICREVTR